MSKAIRLLMVEDSEDDAALLLRALKQGGFDVQYERVYSAAALKEALAERQWDAVVSDFRMPGFTGLDALRIYRSTGLDIPFMLISGTIGEETAVQAMKGGASDYIMKQSLARLAPALERELKETQARAAHRRDQEALADSETRFRQMAETIRDVFFLINAERTQMLYVSPAYEDIWGQSCKDLYANPESWTAAIHPDDRTAVYNNYQRHIGSPEQELEDQYRIVRPDGTIRWIESRAFPVHDTDGRIVRIAGVAKDITDRMNAAQELRESERRFSDMLGNVELVSLMLDRESRITYCNDYLLRLTGWQYEEVIGQSWPQLFLPPDIVDERNAAFAAMLANQPRARHRENEILTRSGERRLIHWNNTVLRSGAGDAIGIASIGEDITERRLAEAALLRFSAAMDATADAIYLVDRSSMRFVHVNDAACRMQSKTREELLALEPWALLSTSRTELEQTYDAVIASGADAEPMELLRLRKDGSQAWVELRRHAQRSGDRWTIVSLVRDITERKRATQELRDSEARFRSLIELSTDWYWQQDEEYRFVRFSGGERKDAWGQDQRHALGLRRWELPGIVPVSGSWQEHQAVLAARKPFRNFEYQRCLEDGTAKYVAASGEPVFDADGRFRGYRGVATDVTERKEAENKIRRLNRVYAVLSGINTLIVRVRERDELFREACRIAVGHGGFCMAWIGLVDRNAMELVPIAAAGATRDPATLVNERFSLLEVAPHGNVLSARAIREKTPAVANDVRNDPAVAFKEDHARRGSRSMAILPLLVSGDAVGLLALYATEAGFFDDEELKLLTELAGDIGFAIDHIDQQERIDYLAYYDPLTGLANRRLFLDRMAQHMRSAISGRHQLVIFLIDVERFKNINDSLGQAAGDALLRQVAEWLTRNVGDPGLLAHLGADHFAIMLPEVREEGDLAQLIEQRIGAFVEHPFRLDDAVFRIAIKVGAALFPDDATDAETLFRNAEAALKRAKASGERYLFYTQKMTELVAGKLTLENQLRRALDNEEFVLHYQPKVNLASGRMVGAEALIRWNDPHTGLVAPGRFIPVLEEIGLIHDVGRWALRRAIADYLRWRAAGLPAVRLAVNVSPLQLRNRGFIAEVAQAVGIDAQAAAGLELEITESLIMEDVRHNIAGLQAIRALGVSIAIDDFGTGFSSLSYLAKLPVDTLKIDRSFVIDMTASPDGLALVSTIINLAHSLRLKVVAEGVETDEQSRLLRLLNCDEMQGYLFSKPLPAELFEANYLIPSGKPGA